MLVSDINDVCLSTQNNGHISVGKYKHSGEYHPQTGCFIKIIALPADISVQNKYSYLGKRT